MPWVRAGRRLLEDVENSGPRPAGEGDGRGSGGAVWCQGPGKGRAVSIRSDSSVGVCEHAESMGTSRNGQ